MGCSSFFTLKTSLIREYELYLHFNKLKKDN